MIILPVNAEPDRRFQIQLGENLLTVRTYFNESVPAWFMDLSDSDGQVLAAGLALVPTVNVLEASPELTRRLGQFRVFPLESTSQNTSASKVEPLWWFAPGEWEAGEIAQQVDVTLPFSVNTMYSLVPSTGSAPFDELVLQALQAEAVTERLYDLVNLDFYPRLS